MKVKRYKSTRKYRCPFCRITATRDKLISHIQDQHEDMIPEDYTAARLLYDHINHKNYGTCIICKKPVYEWDETICRYKNLCDDPHCMAQLKARSAKNHLEDPEVQKKMLAGRRISGFYKFKDGTTHSYVGSYERNCFEFMDLVLNIEGKDIMSPGPTIYYEWNGEQHPWILDWMYIPAMLCADVKDGGSNPNNRPMEDYRERQIAKEEAITKLGKYNYIRLTDNNFAQLLEALANIRQGTINHDPLNHIFINEKVQIDYDETIADILDLNKRLNSYKYSYKDYKDFAKEYRVASPEKFEKQQGGVCWDFAAYEAWWFKKNHPDISFTTWYVIFDNNNDCPTHTFLTFRYKGKLYYFESAFGKTMGVWQVKSEKDAINFVMDSMIGKTKLGEYPYYVIKYDATDKKLIGVGVMSYMERMSELIEKSTYKHTFSKQYSAEKVTLKPVNETSYYARPDKEVERYLPPDGEDDDDDGTSPIYPDTYSPNVDTSISSTYFNYESVGGMPSNRAHNDYIVPRMMNGLVFDGGQDGNLYFGNTGWDKLIHFDAEENPHWEEKELALMPLVESYRIVFKNSDILSKLSKKEITSLGEDGLISKMMGRPYRGIKDLLMCEDIASISSDVDNDLIRGLITNGIVTNVKHVITEQYMKDIIKEEMVETKDNVMVYKDDDGYYLTTPDDFLLTSNHYPSYTDIPDNLFTLMNDLYKNRKRDDPNG